MTNAKRLGDLWVFEFCFTTTIRRVLGTVFLLLGVALKHP